MVNIYVVLAFTYIIGLHVDFTTQTQVHFYKINVPKEHYYIYLKMQYLPQWLLKYNA